MTNEGVKVHPRFALFFNHTHEAVETSEPVHFLTVAYFRRIEGIAKESQRLIISLQRHRMRVAIFPAMSERKPGRIVEATRRAVNDFSN